MTKTFSPLKDWMPPTQNLTKRILWFEVLLLSFITLGENAVYAFLKLLSYATQPDLGLSGMGKKEITMSGIYSHQAWYDTALHIANFAFSLVPVLLAAWLIHNSGMNVKDLWASGKGKVSQWLKWSDLGRALGMASLVGGLGVGFYLLSHQLGFAATIKVGDSLETWRYWFFLLLDSLSTSVLEEFIVVGYLLVRLCQLGFRTSVALIIAAIFRGTYHLYQGLWGFVGNFFMGVAFGYLYLRWGRIAPLVIAHFIMDGVAFMSLALLAPHVGWIPTAA